MLEEKAGSDSPTAQAIAAYEEYARAHLPRLVEEALENSVAEQMQPIEESLRRAPAGIVRDCYIRLAQNFLQHRSSNPDAPDVQVETLPSFYIEPLNLTDENCSPNHIYGDTYEQGVPGPQTDSGYESLGQLIEPNIQELLGDWNMPFGLDYPYGANDNGTGMQAGNEIILGDND